MDDDSARVSIVRISRLHESAIKAPVWFLYIFLSFGLIFQRETCYFSKIVFKEFSILFVRDRSLKICSFTYALTLRMLTVVFTFTLYAHVPSHFSSDVCVTFGTVHAREPRQQETSISQEQETKRDVPTPAH